MRRWSPIAFVLAALVAAACSSPPAPPPPSSSPPVSPLVQAACDGRLQGSVAGQVQSSALTETSGIAASRSNNGVLWAHNDSGDTARVFAMTTAGQHLGSFTLAGASAVDWEDMAVGPGPEEGQSYLYAADVGDNARTRESVVVYRVAEPVVDVQTPGGEQPLGGVETIELRYPDGAHDAEALAVDPDTGNIVIVTKEPSGSAGVYVHPAGAPAGTLMAHDPIALESGTLVTGASVAPQGDAVVLRTYSSVLVFHRPSGRPLHEAFGSSPCSGASATEPQGEAIAVSADGRGYATVSEGAQPPIHRFDVTPP